MIKFLTQEQMNELKLLHRRCNNKRHADRIKSVLLRNKRYSFEEIAQILLLDDSTIRQYLEEFDEEGIEELLKDNWKGGKGKLSKIQEEELKDHISANLYLTTFDIIEYVQKKYDTSYKERGMNNLLHRLGFVYKKPKQVPGKADKKRQEEFIKTYEELKTTKDKNDRIWFLDGVHPRHNAMPAYGWILKGKEKQLKANTKRKGLNINGALNIEDMDVVTREDDRINAESTINLIKQVELKQPKGKIFLIADNARYNYAKDVKEYIEKQKRIQILYLPPYSPNLNTIERLWKLYKKKILYNKYYEKCEQFIEETRNFFANVKEQYFDEMKSLLTDNFHVIGLN